MIRSALSILAGVLVYVALAFGANVALAETAPEWFGPRGEVTRGGVLALILALYAAFAVAAGYVAAWRAPRAGLRHALAAGAFLAALALWSAVASPEAAPGWFDAALVLVVAPASAAGGWLRGRSTRAGAAPSAPPPVAAAPGPPSTPKQARKRRK